MVYGDREYNQEAIAHLNSTSPLGFSDAISAEDLARDLDIFTNTQFFDFDLGGPSSTPFSSLDSSQKDDFSATKPPHTLTSESKDADFHTNFSFLSDEPLSFDLNAIGTTSDDSPSTKRRKTSEADAETPVFTPYADDAARAAAEEDKRRRNTLASARFRAKKKMREQALEKDHKEMLAKLDKMENRIKELELENKWLRGLIVQNKS